MSKLMIGWTTCEDMDAAERLATGLVERDLAACVQIEPGIRSFYKWKGKVESAPECRLCIKFDASKVDEVSSHLEANHPYENPEWLATEADVVAQAYLQWATGA